MICGGSKIGSFFSDFWQFFAFFWPFFWVDFRKNTFCACLWRKKCTFRLVLSVLDVFRAVFHSFGAFWSSKSEEILGSEPKIPKSSIWALYCHFCDFCDVVESALQLREVVFGLENG